MKKDSQTTLRTVTENAEVEITTTADGKVRVEFPRGVLPIASSLALTLSSQGAETLGRELLRVAELARAEKAAQ